MHTTGHCPVVTPRNDLSQAKYNVVVGVERVAVARILHPGRYITAGLKCPPLLESLDAGGTDGVDLLVAARYAEGEGKWAIVDEKTASESPLTYKLFEDAVRGSSCGCRLLLSRIGLATLRIRGFSLSLLLLLRGRDTRHFRKDGCSESMNQRCRNAGKTLLMLNQSES